MAAITITLTYRSYTVASPTVISATTITVNVPTNLTADAHIKNIAKSSKSLLPEDGAAPDADRASENQHSETAFRLLA